MFLKGKKSKKLEKVPKGGSIKTSSGAVIGSFEPKGLLSRIKGKKKPAKEEQAKPAQAKQQPKQEVLKQEPPKQQESKQEAPVTTASGFTVSTFKPIASSKSFLKKIPEKVLVNTRVLLILALIVVLVLGYFFFRRATSPRVACTTNILTEAAVYLSPEESSQLEPHVIKIKEQKGYERDPNCMYIIVTYHINKFELDTAKQSLEILGQSYNKETPLAPELGLKKNVYEELKTRIERLEKLRKDLETNTLYFN